MQILQPCVLIFHQTGVRARLPHMMSPTRNSIMPNLQSLGLACHDQLLRPTTSGYIVLSLVVDKISRQTTSCPPLCSCTSARVGRAIPSGSHGEPGNDVSGNERDAEEPCDDATGAANDAGPHRPPASLTDGSQRSHGGWLERGARARRGRTTTFYRCLWRTGRDSSSPVHCCGSTTDRRSRHRNSPCGGRSGGRWSGGRWSGGDD